MRKLLTFTVVLAFWPVASFAQAPSDADQLWSQLRKASTLENLHETLRTQSNLHDTYLYIAGSGNEQSVPLLLERLRLDYGASQRGDASGIGMTFDCAQVHLIDALRAITNTDQGMYYPRWESWWEANREYSQQRWIRDGFAAKGLHVSEPVDEQFGFELVELMGREQNYLNYNAIRLLKGVPLDQRAKWAARAAASDQRSDRFAAIQISSLFAIDGKDALLRRLTADPDLEIRRTALTRLNDHLRVSASATPGEAHILREANQEKRIRGMCFLGDSLLVVFRDGEVKAFDMPSFRSTWTSRVLPGAGDQILAVKDRVFLASQEGAVAAVDSRGHVLWSRQPDDEKNEVRRIIFHGDKLLLVRLESVDQLDPNTGLTKASTRSHNLLKDADSTDSSAFFIDGSGLHSLDAAALQAQFSVPAAVSVNEQSVCVIATFPEYRLTCMEPSSLALQWTQPVGKNGTWGHQVAPIPFGSQVFVPTDTDLTAFNAADGSLQWTAFGGQEAHGSIVATDYGLLLQSMTYKLELRDLKSGEVRRVWPQLRGVYRLAVHQHIAAVTDFDGALWLVDLQN